MKFYGYNFTDMSAIHTALASSTDKNSDPGWLIVDDPESEKIKVCFKSGSTFRPPIVSFTVEELEALSKDIIKACSNRLFGLEKKS